MHILHVLMFYPRGGSAYVARELALNAISQGHQVNLVSGSLGALGELTNADTFYSGIRVASVNYDSGMQDFNRGYNARLSNPPFHPSYEDRGNVPDRPFSTMTSHEYAISLRFWTDYFRDLSTQIKPDLIHVHHLTTQIVGLREAFGSSLPVIQHFHGTELKHLQSHPQSNQPWCSQSRRVAQLADKTIVLSRDDFDKASTLLDLGSDVLEIVPNGVDAALFHPQVKSLRYLLRELRAVLITNPKGSDPNRPRGQFRYDEQEIARLAMDVASNSLPLIVYVGRFTRVKRVDLLLSAIGELESVGEDCALLIAGGFPGEHEGEHPVLTVRHLGLSRVFFAGWRSRDELASLLPQMDALVLPSSDESFGQVLLEAMASGIPVIAAKRGGPRDFVDDRVGWTFEPDSHESLVRALREFRKYWKSGDMRKSEAAREIAMEKYNWKRIGLQVETIYKSITDLDTLNRAT